MSTIKSSDQQVNEEKKRFRLWQQQHHVDRIDQNSCFSPSFSLALFAICEVEEIEICVQ